MSQTKSKRLLLGICFFVLFTSNGFGQANGDYQSAATGNWSSPSTWQKRVSGAWAAAGANPAPTFADGVITILAGHTVTFDASISVDQLVINSAASVSGATLIVSPSATMTILDGSGVDLLIKTAAFPGKLINNGTITNSGQLSNLATAVNTFVNNLNINNSGTITNAASGVFSFANNSPAIVLNSGTITTSATSCSFNSGSKYQHNFTASTGTIPLASWDANSTCEIIACLGPSSGPININQRFGHFIWDNTGQAAGDINFAGLFIGTQTNGNFTMKSTGSGRLVFKGTNTGATAIGGNFIMTGGTLVITNGLVGDPFSNLFINVSGSFSQTGGTLILSENTGPSISTNGSASLTIGLTTLLNGGTLTLTNSNSTTSSQGNGTFTSSGAMTISAGTLNLTTSSGSGSGGAGTLNTNSTLNVSGGILNLCSSTRTGGGGSGTVVSTGLITLSGGTINGSSASATGISGCNSTIQANGGLTVSSGSLNLTPGNITGGGGDGFINVTGTLTVTGGLINVNSSTATAGTVGSNGSIAVTGNCNINTGAPTINITSSTTTAGGGSGSLSATGAFTMSSGTLNVCSTSGAGTGNGTLNIDGNFSLSGTSVFNITSSSTTASGVGTGTLSVAGTFSHTTAAASFARTATNATATGTVNIDGIASFTQTIESTNGFSGTITFNISQGGSTGAVAQIPATKTFLVNSATTVNISDNSVSTLADLTVIGTFTVNGTVNVLLSAELDMGSVAMTGTGNFIMSTDATLLTQHATGISATAALGCIQVSGTKTYASDGNYTYYGTASQVTGDGLPASITGVLTISNTVTIASGGVTLSRATTILFGPNGAGTSGQLTLTSGRLITTSTNLITLGDAVAVSAAGGGTSKFVDGPIKKIGFTAGTPFIFPTGDVYTASPGGATAKWARISVSQSGTSTTDAFIAEYHKINDPCTALIFPSSTFGSGIDHVSYKEYWDLTRAAGSSSPTVKLYWENGSVSASAGSAISSIATADLHVAELIGGTSGTWTDLGVGAITGTTGTGTITNSTAPTFSSTTTAMPLTFSAPNLINPLPIELLTFNGTSVLLGNQIDWSTATETNNNYFDLERSSNGSEFTKITTVNGAGNSVAVRNYQYLDKNPMNGMNYYRLKQVDNNGGYDYSAIIVIDNANDDTASVEVYPNPSNDFVNIVSSENIVSYTVYNSIGEIVYTNASDQQRIQFNPISKGIYVINAISKQGKTITTRFVKN